MNCLILYAHPNPKSFCHAILQKTLDTLRLHRWGASVRDLYAMGFDPVLGGKELAGLEKGCVSPVARREQAYVRKADLLVLIYPVWWTGMPAILKGYVDRVLANGFAYTFGPNGVTGLLKGKKAILLTTQGASKEEYEKNGSFEAMRISTDAGIFEFCGMQVLNHRYFAQVQTVSHEVRTGYLSEIEAIVGPHVP